MIQQLKKYKNQKEHCCFLISCYLAIFNKKYLFACINGWIKYRTMYKNYWAHFGRLPQLLRVLGFLKINFHANNINIIFLRRLSLVRYFMVWVFPIQEINGCIFQGFRTGYGTYYFPDGRKENKISGRNNGEARFFF